MKPKVQSAIRRNVQVIIRYGISYGMPKACFGYGHRRAIEALKR